MPWRLTARVAQGVAVVFAAASLAFVLIKVAPGDQFMRFSESPGASRAVIANWRHIAGEDQPVLQQYGRWLANIARGDLGVSTSLKRDVSAVLADAIPNTLLLMVLAFVSSVVFGVAIGAWQGAHEGSWRDRFLSHASLVLYSMPEFWLALGLMMVFALWLGLLPTMGMTGDMYTSLGPIDRVKDRLYHLVLPWFTLTLIGTSIFARFQRSAMREVMREPFVRTARSKGVGERSVRYRHALRAALLPVIAIGGLLFPTLLTGAVFVETIFSWPGMGHTLVAAADSRDTPLVCGAVIVGSAMTALGALVADLLREAADPRTRRE